MKPKKCLVIAFVLLFQGVSVFSQEKNSIAVGVDFVSRYLWRGANIGGESAHIQPLVAVKYKNLEVGAWGSYGVSNEFSEYDFYAKCTVKNFSLAVTNYNVPVEGNLTTPDSYAEFTLSYTGVEKLPLYANYSRYFYNDDASYLDLGYKFNTNKQLPMDFNVGMTPAAGSYAEKGGIVNISLKISYDIKFSERFKVPVFTSLIVNPEAEKTFWVFGLAFSSN